MSQSPVPDCASPIFREDVVPGDERDPVDEPVVPGATYPDGSPRYAWPSRPPPSELDARIESLEALAAKLTAENAELRRQLDREDRLRSLGFEEPTAEQRAANIASYLSDFLPTESPPKDPQ